MENNTSSGQNAEASGQGEQNVSYSSHQKLLGEKKKLQQEFESMKSRLEAIEQEKLESQGKLKELNEMLNKKATEAESRSRTLHRTYAEKIMRQQFDIEASRLGCIDPDLAFKATELSGVQLGEDLSLDADGLKSALAETMKAKPFLFKKDVPGIKDATPNNQMKEKLVNELSKDEILAELKKLG